MKIEELINPVSLDHGEHDHSSESVEPTVGDLLGLKLQASFNGSRETANPSTASQPTA